MNSKKSIYSESGASGMGAPLSVLWDSGGGLPEGSRPLCHQDVCSLKLMGSVYHTDTD